MTDENEAVSISSKPSITLFSTKMTKSSSSIVMMILFYVAVAAWTWAPSEAFQSPVPSCGKPATSTSSTSLLAADDSKDDLKGVEQYRNVATEFLSNFMQKRDDQVTDNSSASEDPLQGIDFNAPKQPVHDLDTLAAILDYELYQKEWFVTGNVNPVYFSNDFLFQDPDVTLNGIEQYANGVNTLFDQDTARAEIIETVVNPELGPNVITCTWRLSGKVNIGPGFTIKPYIVFSDFTVQDGLVVRQEDRFDLPQWDILLSFLFPFLIGKLTKPPAPPVEPRIVPRPKALSKGPIAASKDGSSSSPFDVITNIFNKSR